MNTVHSKDGTAIAFDAIGEGPPLILVDGALCYRGLGPTTPLTEPLKRDFVVFTFDRRGRGDSGDTAPYAVEREVEDVQALIEAAGGAAYLFGISSGAALALEVARREPAVKGLALYEVPFIVDDTRPPIRSDYAVNLARFFAADRRGDRWASVAMASLVVAGGKSPAWLHRGAQALADALPNAELRVLEGQTHNVKAKALAPLLTGFFRGEAAAAEKSGEPIASGSRS